MEMMSQALTVPCKTIANNAGAEGAVVVGKLLESAEANFGFNAQASPDPKLLTQSYFLNHFIQAQVSRWGSI